MINVCVLVMKSSSLIDIENVYIYIDPTQLDKTNKRNKGLDHMLKFTNNW